MTDEARHYGKLGREFAAHHTTNHSDREYARRLLEISGYVGPAFPVRLSRADTRTAPAEPLGASSESVLRELLGLGDPELAMLREQGALG